MALTYLIVHFHTIRKAKSGFKQTEKLIFCVLLLSVSNVMLFQAIALHAFVCHCHGKQTAIACCS